MGVQLCAIWHKLNYQAYVKLTSAGTHDNYVIACKTF